MRKIEKTPNSYSISKTLQFKLLPVGKTLENFDAKQLLAEDEQRAKLYPLVKGYMDRYHKSFIESVLSKLVLEDISDYAQLYYKSNKSEAELKLMAKTEDNMRKAIAKAFKADSRNALLFKKEMITELLPSFLTDKEELEIVERFKGFSTYFTGFNENRKNMYSEEEKSTAIGYRCINDNLPKFLDNAKSFEKVKSVLCDDIATLNSDFEGLLKVRAEDVFDIDYFTFVLSQSDIKRYNEVIGGYTFSDGKKIKGINEYINLHNQVVDRCERLPLMKPLFKQILSDSESISFIPEKFKDDNEALDAVKTYYEQQLPVIDSIKELFNSFDEYDMKGIHITSGLAVTDISNAVFGNWSSFADGWKAQYEENNPRKKNEDDEKFYDRQSKAYKANKSFSLDIIQKLSVADEKHDGNVVKYYSDSVSESVKAIKTCYNNAKLLLSEKYTDSKPLSKNDDAIELLKSLLDSIKALERLIKPLLGSGKEEYKDNTFYGKFAELYTSLTAIDKLYDRVRNHITQKPDSKNKIKLNFENPQFLGGWDRNKEKDYRSVLLMDNEGYYLAIMDKGNSDIFTEIPYDGSESYYEKIEYKLLPGPNKMLPKVFFAKSNIDYFAPSDEIMRIYKAQTFKKGADFKIKDCHTLIDFYKQSLNKHADWSKFGFTFDETKNYKDIGEFYRDLKEQGYSIKMHKISRAYIESLVNEGKLYLFKIYNKDFSPYSKGKPNLHTMYFKMLFDQKNLENIVYQLNGGAEMFYRKAMIPKHITHPANEPLSNKNPDNPKKQSVFEYDLIKDKRYTDYQFSLHMPITLNFRSEDNTYINNDVRKLLVECDDNYVIGIDRGERNLLYICVINSKGEIVHQESLNDIITSYNNDKGEAVELKTDYHTLLSEKEKKRDDERKSWKTIENIKELKEGYLSQVVHRICQLVVKYDAIIALEDLNRGFKSSRTKVEKQVYQKFETMLETKLQYLVDKNLSPDAMGGLLNAYQLTNKDSLHTKQNGFIFYVPAWMTSKIDPVTGFTDLMYLRFESMIKAKEFIKKLDDISYNSKEDIFEIALDYSKLSNSTLSYKTKWTICTNSQRIRTFRNKAKNNEFDTETLVLTDEFKKLFDKYDIDISGDIRDQILKLDDKKFFEGFISLLKLTLQMRNSIPNTQTDYLISPVKNSEGKFFDSRDYEKLENAPLPQNADANGAYNIARKALWAINVLKNTPAEQLSNANLSITNKEWLELAQK